MSETSDGALVEAIRAGDVARFAEVVERHDRRVRAVIVGCSVREAADVEDLVQKAFYLAFRGLGRLRSGEKLEAWLVRIATRCALEHLRRGGREERLAGTKPAGAPAERSPLGAAWIWEEVDALDEAFRDMLRLRYEGGMSYAEIARAKGVPVSTVRGRLYEARRALRRRLADG